MFPEIVMLGHCVEVKDKATTTYESIYQTLHKPQLQNLKFHLTSSRDTFTHTNLNWKFENCLKGRGTNARVEYTKCVPYIQMGKSVRFCGWERMMYLRPFVDSYAKELPPTFKKICCLHNRTNIQLL